CARSPYSYNYFYFDYW
nr:immunoglobulin heavy chain junction region [Macaca mulatta]